MRKIKALLIKYGELLRYAVVGGGTTAVSFLVFALFQRILGEGAYLLSNALAWLAAVVFAYVANKMWVFRSESWRSTVLLREIPSFLGARVLSFAIEEVGLLALVEWLDFGSFSTAVLGVTVSGALLAKLLLAVIVAILNYLFSKLIIFRK